ncbi:MAG: glycogen debranching enzyme N-terminal domain-containing protein [Planctomycetes bacterium]|nr:glycogen debranching enzyme N-terminal domain-containing protein [Planctomycetota bacterium]MBI3845481.1 glycogen debranching enzyme N-terminal domain-containing protein [Planctomycetota bacterium]
MGTELCTNLREALLREWLETNGLGGYASSTVAGANTRRYHGLLVAAMHPPLGRRLLLSKLEDEWVVDGHRTPLSCNVYAGTVHPRGHEKIVEFRLDPFPTWTFDVGGARVEKSIFLVHGEHTVVVCYRLLPGGAAEALLELSPLLAYRNFHSLTHENASLDPRIRWQDGRLALTPYSDLPTMWIEGGAERVEAMGYWYRNFEFPRDAELGVEFREDVFCPCRLVYRLHAGQEVAFVATLESVARPDAAALRAREIERRRAAATVEGLTAPDPALEALSLASESFLVRRGESGASVIAGYPWLAEWGMDASLALPGLTLARKRPDEARRILLTLSAARDRMVIPNYFMDDREDVSFESAIASLCFIRALAEYYAATGDVEGLRTGLYRAASDVLRAYASGSREGIRLDDDGLLIVGGPGLQLTWMEARVDRSSVVPRRGKAVEVNALWYSAHLDVAELARAAGLAADAATFTSEATRIGDAFNRAFWNEARHCLFDAVDAEGRDASLRPNQIIAVSLRHSPLARDKQLAVVEAVREHLLTPFGLRTLASGEPGYVGIYSGNATVRDAAYHNGTVWPFLIGPFVEAWLRVRGVTPQSASEADGFVRPLVEWATSVGLGQIPELFDGDPPHKPRGCIAQAVSVGEVLRAWQLVKRAKSGETGAFAG